MKRYIALLLAVIMCMGLVACGGKTGITDGNQTANKNDYKAIEITMDNWQEYFEFTSTYSVGYKQSEFSEATGAPEWVEMNFLFAVKDEYYSRLDFNNSAVTVQISGDIGIQHGIFSNDASSFDPSGEFEGSPLTVESSEFVNDGERFAFIISTGFAGESEIKDGRIEKYRKNFELLNIKGTLLIAE